jgi:hypothetical protein
MSVNTLERSSSVATAHIQTQSETATTELRKRGPTSHSADAAPMPSLAPSVVTSLDLRMDATPSA